MRAFVDFYVGVACNTNASYVCEIKFTYLLTYSLHFSLPVLLHYFMFCFLSKM